MRILITLLSIVLLIAGFSCSKSGTEQQVDASQAELPETASIQESASSQTESTEISNSASGFTISPSGVGPFRVGERFDTTLIPEGARVNAFNVNSTDANGIKTKSKVNVIVKDDVNLFTLSMEGSTDVIAKVTIPGDAIATAEGIKVGDLIGDFVRAYPLYEIHLNNKEYRIEITTPKYPNTLFLIDPNGYNSDRDKLRSADMVKLEFTDFLEVTKITDIIYVK